MEYYKLLHLTREPFSNSPDPAFFYESDQHKECIQKLEIALRLRRGLNVVTGEVGTGKTTLCRQLIRAFSDDPRISAYLILDPDFSDPRSFLSAVVHMMTSRKSAPDDTIPGMKEQLKHFLFQKGVEEEKTVLLIVDEGQKMSPACLEMLRELLNFETNEYKLLQIIIFAQNEFAETLNRLPNLADRINLYYRLSPLNYKDSRALIHHRLQHAVESESTGRHLFSLPAQWRIFRLSGGYPRKIIHLCHQCLLAMIIQNKSIVRWRIVGACARRTFRNASFFRPIPAAITLLFLAGISYGIWRYSAQLRHSLHAIRSQWVKTDQAKNSPPAADIEETDNQSESNTTQTETHPEEAVSAITVAKQTAAVSSPSFEQTVPVKQENDPIMELSQTDDPADEAPTILGQVTVTMGDTLGSLIHKVYGAYTYRYHQAVLDVNPELANPDRLDVGQLIIFPALSADMTDMPGEIWWIALSRKPDLGAAVSTLRREADASLPLRLLVSWTHSEGFVFRVVLKPYYEDRTSAELEKNRMAFRVSAPMEIIRLEKSGARFFSSWEKITYGTTDDRQKDEHRTSNIE